MSLLILLVIYTSANDGESGYSFVPNSCLHQEDSDSVVVKLLDGDEYPPLLVQCDKEYMIVDVAKDPEWSTYLSSLRKYHYAMGGPIKDDHTNWQQWLVPPMEHFLVSPDCASCDQHHELNYKYATSSAYYMTPTAAGCTQLPSGRIACDMDWDTYACHVCENAPDSSEEGYWPSYEVYNGLNDPSTTLHVDDEIAQHSFASYGLCGFTIRDAKAFHDNRTDTFQRCKTVTYDDVESEAIMPRRKPSLGLDGRFCMCVKPDVNSYAHHKLSKQQIADKQIDKLTSASLQEQSQTYNNNKTIKLYQSDFQHGTYRIQQSATYVIMEDIVFDFNAPEGYTDSPLSTYNGPNDWWPRADQASEYPGAGQQSDPYFLGFWAGITIECSDVTLELNGHELRMSEAFFNQQSFFAIVSLISQAFLPGQGVGFFGADPQVATNVTIRNGNLGLSSHHGILGHFNRDLVIENVNIYDFKTHGIQLTGFDGVTIRNVDVGPNRKVDRLTPYYAHMKALLPIYRSMLLDEQVSAARDECFSFVARNGCVGMSDLVRDVQTLLDMAFEYAVLNRKEQYDDMFALNETVDVQDKEMARRVRIWKDGRDVMINDHESTPTATLYGIFLNYQGSKVFGWYAGSEATKSKNVLLELVTVHDLSHDTLEHISFSQGDTTANQKLVNCLGAPFSAFHIFGSEQVDMISYCNNYYEENGASDECRKFWKQGLQYAGNVVTDIQLLSFELLNAYGMSWNYCTAGASDLASLVDFALRGKQFLPQTPVLMGSMDPMVHPGKGVMGLRLNGVDNANLDTVTIQNIESSTDVGSLLMGPYQGAATLQAPYMTGFTMNMVNGLSVTFCRNVSLRNSHVANIESHSGLAYGVAVWFKSDVDIIGRNGLHIEQVHAGTNVAYDSDELSEDSYPNLKPEACALRIYDDEKNMADVEYDDNLVIECVTGHTGCLTVDQDYTTIGEVKNCADRSSSALLAAYVASKLHRVAMTMLPVYVMREKDVSMMTVVVLVVAVVLAVSAMRKCNSNREKGNSAGDGENVFTDIY